MVELLLWSVAAACGVLVVGGLVVWALIGTVDFLLADWEDEVQ